MTTPNAHRQLPRRDIKFNPLLPGFHDNPYAIYERFRDRHGLIRDLAGDWVVLNYADVKAVLEDPRCAANNTLERVLSKHLYSQRQGKDLSHLQNTLSQWLLFIDPPNHTRLRNLVSQALFQTKVEALCPTIESTVEAAIDRARSCGQMDIMADLAVPLPVMTLAKLLGLPASDCPQLKEWSTQLFGIFEPLMSMADYERLNRVAEQFTDYLRAVVRDRLQHPQDDLLDALIASRREPNGRLEAESENDILSFCTVLISAGTETTVASIGNGMLALLKHPEHLQALHRNPDLIRSAVEEMLRYDSPTQFVARIASEDLHLNGTDIRQGDRLVCCLGAANRDPVRFPSPHAFDITRPNNQHLAFGKGIHYCIGASVARIQIQIAIATLVAHLPHLQLDDSNPTYHPNIVVRCLQSLPVTFTARSTSNVSRIHHDDSAKIRTASDRDRHSSGKSTSL